MVKCEWCEGMFDIADMDGEHCSACADELFSRADPPMSGKSGTIYVDEFFDPVRGDGTCVCHPEIIADVQRHGTCIRGWCPHIRPAGGSTIADSDGDDGA